MKKIIYILITVLLLLPAQLWAFDHEYSSFDSLLKKYVNVSANGFASKVNYAGLKKDQSSLNNFLASLSAVSEQEFNSWTRDERLAFLINAYNGFTIELILKHYPVSSIKKLGSFIKSPWKISFISLFGKKISLDEIEHGMVREKGVFDEPRIHFALVCASIGCPALHNEAFTAAKLERMLEAGLVNFLSDKSRNRYVSGKNMFEVSKIFKWYGGDFNQKYGSVNKLLKKYGKYLVKNDSELSLAEKTTKIEFLEYDWNLNDTASK